MNARGRSIAADYIHRDPPAVWHLLHRDGLVLQYTLDLLDTVLRLQVDPGLVRTHRLEIDGALPDGKTMYRIILAHRVQGGRKLKSVFSHETCQDGMTGKNGRAASRQRPVHDRTG